MAVYIIDRFGEVFVTFRESAVLFVIETGPRVCPVEKKV
jgi:hypothetical protein